MVFIFKPCLEFGLKGAFARKKLYIKCIQSDSFQSVLRVPIHLLLHMEGTRSKSDQNVPMNCKLSAIFYAGLELKGQLDFMSKMISQPYSQLALPNTRLFSIFEESVPVLKPLLQHAATAC